MINFLNRLNNFLFYHSFPLNLELITSFELFGRVEKYWRFVRYCLSDLIKTFLYHL